MFELEEMYADILRSFKNAKNNDKLAHAYLFSSNKDKNVKNIVKYFMMLFYCDNRTEKDSEPCYTCSSCQKIIRETHINYYEVDSTGTSIKKEQIEKLQEEFSKTSLEEGIRVYLIDNCEKMTASSANSLLKFLEEPISKHTYAFLITDNMNECLPTILSRCQIIKMRNKTSDEIFQELGEEQEVTLRCLLSHYCSNISEARALMEDDNYLSILDFVKKIMRMVKTDHRGLLDYYRNNGAVLYVGKENILIFYQLLLYYFLDLYKTNLGIDDIIFKSESDILRGLSDYYGKEKIYSFIQYIKETIKKLYFNINESLLVDELMIKLRK